MNLKRLFQVRHLTSTARRVAGRQLWLALLALVLALGGGGRLPLAQAAPRAVGLIITLTASRGAVGKTICVGDKVPLYVRVNGTSELNAAAGVPDSTPQYGVKVDAHISSGSSGTVGPSTSSTGLTANSAAARFTFAATEVGLAAVFFKMSAGTSTASTAITLKVEECKYRVTAISTWRVPGPAKITLVAKIELAGVSSKGDVLYEGTALVTWHAYSATVGDCDGVLVPQSQAKVSGLRAVDKIVWEITYTPAGVVINIDCKATGGVVQTQVTPAPLTFNVPVSGGAVVRQQILRAPTNNKGPAVVTVTRISD